MEINLLMCSGMIYIPLFTVSFDMVPNWFRKTKVDCLILASELMIGLGMRLERSLRDAANVSGG